MTEQEFKRYLNEGRKTPPETMKDLLSIAEFVKGFFDISQIGGKAGVLVALTVAFEYGRAKADKEKSQGEQVVEDKSHICELLVETVKATRNGSDVVKILYEKDERGQETATVIFDNGYEKKINVTADSGTAMIYDIVTKL